MARYSAGMTTAGAGTTVRPVFAVLTTGSPIVTPVLREISIFNTTTTDCQFELVRFHGGTAGSTVTASKHRNNSPANICLAKQLFTADVTAVDEHTGYFFQLGAAKGSAAYASFGDSGLQGDPTGTTYGLGLVPVGTGQIILVQFTWDE